MDKNRIVVNPDGQVHPCCYFANFNYIGVNNEKDNYLNFWNSNHKLHYNYEQNKDDLNIKNKSMKEILSHDWFVNKLPDSWKEQNTRDQICIKFCQHDE